MSDFIHLQSKLFDNPLAIWKPKADDLVQLLGSRIGMNIEARPMNTSAEPSVSELESTGSIGVIPVRGTLVNRGGSAMGSGLMSYDMLGRMVDEAAANDRVKAVVLDVDSNGGEVAGLFELVDKIKALKAVKPVYAIVNSNAMSAGYAIASTANKVYIPQQSLLGSIGVIITHRNQARKDIAEGIEVTHITVGDKKAAGSPHAFNNTSGDGSSPTMDADHFAFLQSTAEEAYGRFVALVADNRGMTRTAVRDTQALPFVGKSAIKAGLADAIRSPSEAFAAIAEEVAGSTSGMMAAAEQQTTNSEEDMSDNEKLSADVQEEVVEAAAPEAPEADDEVNEEVTAEEATVNVDAMVAEKLDMLLQVEAMVEGQGIPEARDFAFGMIKDGLTLEACALKILEHAAANDVNVSASFDTVKREDEEGENPLVANAKARGEAAEESGNVLVADAARRQ